MAATQPATAATFRAKVAFMKTWKPQSSPSNRDRLELYALHKQAVSGDAPMRNPQDASVADKAKMNAWRGKRGLTQAEAMTQYVSEADRQVRNYGTRAAPGSESTGSGSTPRTTTPTNTPAGPGTPISQPSNVSLTPRGLAAVPLLCAAAAESRAAYLARLAATAPENGWWARQEPLCADPGTPLSAPEGLVIGLATKTEGFSLATGAASNDLPVSPSVVQAFLWPLHNILLAIWIELIFISTLIGSALMAAKTILVGANRTEVPLDRIFTEEIIPASRAATGLCEPHQAITVRLAGLTLMPLVTICDISKAASDVGGILAGSSLYVFSSVMTWWYWICVLPWFSFSAVCIALMSGWCFALIDLAGM